MATTPVSLTVAYSAVADPTNSRVLGSSAWQGVPLGDLWIVLYRPVGAAMGSPVTAAVATTHVVRPAMRDAPVQGAPKKQWKYLLKKGLAPRPPTFVAVGGDAGGSSDAPVVADFSPEDALLWAFDIRHGPRDCYCPVCLQTYPLATGLETYEGRCRSCYRCPQCAAPGSIVQSPQGFYLACNACLWRGRPSPTLPELATTLSAMATRPALALHANATAKALRATEDYSTMPIMAALLSNPAAAAVATSAKPSGSSSPTGSGAAPPPARQPSAAKLPITTPAATKTAAVVGAPSSGVPEGSVPGGGGVSGPTAAEIFDRTLAAATKVMLDPSYAPLVVGAPTKAASPASVGPLAFDATGALQRQSVFPLLSDGYSLALYAPLPQGAVPLPAASVPGVVPTAAALSSAAEALKRARPTLAAALASRNSRRGMPETKTTFVDPQAAPDAPLSLPLDGTPLVTRYTVMCNSDAHEVANPVLWRPPPSGTEHAASRTGGLSYCGGRVLPRFAPATSVPNVDVSGLMIAAKSTCVSATSHTVQMCVLSNCSDFPARIVRIAVVERRAAQDTATGAGRRTGDCLLVSPGRGGEGAAREIVCEDAGAELAAWRSGSRAVLPCVSAATVSSLATCAGGYVVEDSRLVFAVAIPFSNAAAADTSSDPLTFTLQVDAFVVVATPSMDLVTGSPTATSSAESSQQAQTITVSVTYFVLCSVGR